MQLVERVGFCHGTMLLQSTHVIIQLCKYGYRVCVERCSTSFRGVSASYSRGPEPMSFQMRMNPVYFPFLQQRVGDVSEASGNHQYKTIEAAFPIGGYGNESLIVEPFAHPTILFSILPVSPNKETRAIK